MDVAGVGTDHGCDCGRDGPWMWLGSGRTMDVAVVGTDHGCDCGRDGPWMWLG